jgi:hypothetical protein
LITKSALIEQAFALSQYDIDSLSKYDEQYLKISQQDSPQRRSNTETRKVDALQKERIFHYHTQVLASKVPAHSQSNSVPIISSSRETDSSLNISSASTVDKPSAVPSSTSNAINVAPPPSLVAALRRVFDGKGVDQSTEEPALASELAKLNIDTKLAITRKDSGSVSCRFELRNLLQAISNHPIFISSVATSSDTVAAQQDHVATGAKINFDDEQINLEKVIMNATKQLTSNSEEGSTETSLQGLLITILSLLTTSQSGFNVRTITTNDQKKEELLGDPKSPGPNVVERQDTDLPVQLTLQVGALLSLLPLESTLSSCTSSPGSNATADTEATDSASLRLNPELLDYFASAAVVYQERWEIRKARRLARVQTPPELLGRCDTPPLISSKEKETLTIKDDDVEHNNIDNAQQEGDQQPRSNATAHAETPTAGDRGAPDMEFSVRTEDDDNILMTPTNNNSATPINSVNENRYADPPTSSIDPPASSNTEPLTVSDREDQDLLSHDHVNNSSDNELNDDDQGDNEGDTMVPYDMAREVHDSMSRNTVERLDDEVDDNDDDEDDVEEPSSSSESESSDDDDEDGMGDSDDADALDTDDEDTVLRQAMAMSMAEQEEMNTEGQGSGEVNPKAKTDRNANVAVAQQRKAIEAAETSVVQETGSHPIYEDDDSNLPPFPDPPTSYQFLLSTESSTSVLAPTLTKLDAESLYPISQLDPSKLSDFGSIPSCYVLFHLLRYTKLELDRRLSIHAKARSTVVVVPGGVGSALFHSNSDQPDSFTNVHKESIVTLQLLVATFLLMLEHRNEAIENLRKSIAREQRMAHDGTYDSEDENTAVNDDDESCRFPLSLSGEEDDPALTLAMNYVDDDAPLSSESLESKGMTRKAAAAAYDAAVMMKSLRKSTNSWKYEVQLTSNCVACSLQTLRMYLQSMVRQYFMNASLAEEGSNYASVADFHMCFPETVKVQISQGLASLMSIGTQSSFLAMMSGDVIETERLFQSCNLYKQAVDAWGECVPLLHCSDSALSNLLRSLIDECSGFDKRLPHLISLEKLNDFPNSDVETQFYKVSKICCRLRVGDLLDGLVSRPLHFVADMSVDAISDDNYASQCDLVESKLSTRSVSALLTFLVNSVESLVGDHSELKYFYLALCHRCQSRALLLDGFYLETETELDDRHALIATAKTLTTGDTVRVAASPSAALQFDATKCSDSIAAYTGQDDDSRVLSSGIYSVHQRASKVWGTVLSTQQYSPKTGVHRWAVRLDKCERGHVFIGVATSQATMKTYVGGDKHGWGMIGTQALWHDRRKVCRCKYARSS